MKNILTFDIEEWYDANYKDINVSDIDKKKSMLKKEIQVILDLIEKYKAKATFFILGRVAEENPAIIKMIKDKGHEIASHGYNHELVYNSNPELFREDLKKSLEILESLNGKKILGYRAPSWSFNEKTKWVYPVLSEMGLRYSASVFPVKNFLYGIPNSPRFPYSVNNLLEIPTSTIRLFGKNIPFSGGFYFRFWPLFLLKRAIKKVNKKGHPVILYLHPREINPNSPKLKISFKENFFHYWGVSKTKDKLEKILKNYQFGSIESELLPKY